MLRIEPVAGLELVRSKNIKRIRAVPYLIATTCNVVSTLKAFHPATGSGAAADEELWERVNQLERLLSDANSNQVLADQAAAEAAVEAKAAIAAANARVTTLERELTHGAPPHSNGAAQADVQPVHADVASAVRRIDELERALALAEKKAVRSAAAMSRVTVRCTHLTHADTASLPSLPSNRIRWRSEHCD
jgi:hypothetical protein